MKALLKWFVFLTLIAQPVFSGEFPQGHNLTFLLPIDWSAPKHLNLSVTIPKNYQSLQPFSSWEKAQLIEFIPEEEKAGGWSEIITINKFIGEKIPASLFKKTIKQELAQRTKIKVLFEDDSTSKYQMASLGVRYTYQGKDEILGIKCFSGPYDCEVVQYTIGLNGKRSEKEALEKIKKFFNENLKVIESP